MRLTGNEVRRTRGRPYEPSRYGRTGEEDGGAEGAERKKKRAGGRKKREGLFTTVLVNGLNGRSRGQPI